MKIVKFKNWTCKLEIMTYSNDRTALMLIDAETHEPIATATVNLPEAPLASDEVIIKNWSENKGMTEALLAANIIEPPHDYVASGFLNKIPICKLKLNA